MEATQGKKKGFIRGRLARMTGKATPQQNENGGSSSSKVRPTPSFSTQYNYVYKPVEAVGGGFHDPNGAKHVWGNGGDENVDAKAASYISYVRERFKLERLDSNGGYKYQETL